RRMVVYRMIATAIAGASLGLIAVLLEGSAVGAWFLAAALLCVALLAWLCRVLRNYAAPTTFLRVAGDVVLIPRWTNPQEHKPHSLSELYWVEHRFRKRPERGAVLLGFRRRGHVWIPSAAFASRDDIDRFVEEMRSVIIRNEGGPEKLAARESVARRFGLEFAAWTICLVLILSYGLHRRIVDPDAGLVFEFLRIGGMSGYLLAFGEYYRLATAAFVHLGPMHVLANMIVIVAIGSVPEPILKSVNFSIVFLASVLAGALCSAWLSRHVVAVGASGGAYGLIGAYVYIRLMYLELLPAKIRGHKIRILYCAVLVDLAYGFHHPSVDFFAHLGGFVAGMLCAAVLTHKESIESAGRANLPRLSTFVGLIVVYATSFGMLYTKNEDYDPVAYRERLIDRVLADERSPSDGLVFARYADMLEFTVDWLLEDA